MRTSCGASKLRSSEAKWLLRPKIITQLSASRRTPRQMRSAKPSANLRANIILTSIPGTKRPKRDLRRSPKPTTFSAIRRSARFTTRLASTPTTSIPRLRRLMRGPVALPVQDFQGVHTRNLQEAPGKAFHSILADLISLISLVVAVQASGPAVDFAISFPASFQAAEGQNHTVPNRELILNIR